MLLPPVSGLRRRWRSRLAKCALALALLWVGAAHFFPSWGEMEAVERLRATQRRHEREMIKSGHKDVDFLGDETGELDLQRKRKAWAAAVNEINSDNIITKKRRVMLDDNSNNDNSNGYKNSQTLQVYWICPFSSHLKLTNLARLQEKLKPKLVPRHGGDGGGGEGKGKLWDDLGAARNMHDLEIKEEGYRRFAFNSLVSRRIGVRRSQELAIPDTRHPECRKKTYPPENELPTASVIICFYHEELETLLRTVYSVIDRTPEKLLKEIILVNDHSDIDIMSNLTEHIERNDLGGVVQVLTPPERLGLIRARVFGSRRASADVLVFLDSHVEANVQWLEPLLERVSYFGISICLTCFPTNSSNLNLNLI